MAKKKKGPRQTAGLKCKKCSAFGYITQYNKINEQLKKQQDSKGTFPLMKYCSVCQTHQEHLLSKKLK